MSSTIAPPTTFTAPVVTIHGESEGMNVTIPAEATTLEGFRSWAKSDAFPQRGEVSFIVGEVLVDMSPENFDLHNFLKGEISSSLRNLVRQRNLGRFFFDRCLFTNADAVLSTEPDAMFLSYESYQAGKAKYVESRMSRGSYVELIGSPDWALEIVSPSSSKKDKHLLRKAYYRAGVNEYWIVDATGDDVEFTVLVRGKSGFVAVRPRDGWHQSPTFGAAFQLSRSKAKDGLWDYALNVNE
ncbi:MAG: Uma2 family endonuclease [Pirellulales bacterium]